MVLAVPGQGADPVAEPQPQPLQRAGQAVGADPQVGVADPPHRPPSLGRDDLAIARPLGGMVQELVDGEREGLHQLGGL